MFCQKCGKNIATTHVHTVINGVVYNRNLCEYCALEEGFDISTKNPLSDMLSSMFAELRQENSQNEKKCPVCGASFSAIAKSGKAGCTQCYATFKTELLPYLRRVHGSTKHTGKVPYTTGIDNACQNDSVKELRDELNRLIGEENYEQAAVIRDKIRELEAQNNG